MLFCFNFVGWYMIFVGMYDVFCIYCFLDKIYGYFNDRYFGSVGIGIICKIVLIY